MRASRNRTTTALAVLSLLLLLLVPSAFADEATGGGAKNVVLVYNNTDGLKRSGSGVAVSLTGANSVGSENLAYARSSCGDCRTVAVAMQAVLITRDANVIVPKNAAVAVNVDCQSCQTAAFAYQYVLTTGGAVHLSAAGREEVSAIHAEARELAASQLEFPALEEQLDALAARFKSVIDEELTGAGAGALAKRVDRAGVAA